ncbi:MAG: S8/S53 family peptidase, partial [Planctomycetota bacterium]
MRVLRALPPRRRANWCFALLCVLATSVVFAQSRADNIPSTEPANGPSSFVPDEPHEYEPIALSEVIDREGLDPNAVILTSLEARQLPTLGLTMFMGKVLDLQTGHRYAVALDLDGNPIDGAAMLAEERDTYRATYGRIHELLHPMLAAAKTHDVIDIGIWLKTGEIQIPERAPFSSQRKLPTPRPNHPPRDGSAPDEPREDAPTEELEPTENPQDALRRESSTMLEAQMIPVQAPLLAALEEYDLTPSYVSPIAPLIYVSAPKWVILELAERGDVDTIYGPNENRDFNDIAKPSQKADIADFWNFQGSGIEVGILEDSRVEFSNPNLISGTTRVPGDSNVDNHATSTCGMVASQHLTHGGMAQLSSMFSANATDYSDSNLAAALDWAASTQNLDIINNSWGGNVNSTSLNDHDRHCDYIVRNLWSTVTVAAGNDANGCQADTAIVGSP